MRYTYLQKQLQPYMLPLYIGGGTMILIVVLSSMWVNYVAAQPVYGVAPTLVVDYSFEAKLYFNDEPHDKRIVDAIVDEIHIAEHSIEGAFFAITEKNIIQSLQEKTYEDVPVSLVVDSTNQERHNSLTLSCNQKDKLKCINIIFPPNKSEALSGDYMHHKFMMLDRATDDERAIWSSVNFTDLQLRYDSGFVMVTDDEVFIDQLESEWDLLAQEIRGVEKLRPSHKYRSYMKKVQYTNGMMEFWRSPSMGLQSSKYKLIELIQSAKERVDIIIWRLDDDDISAALLRQARQGVEINIITDDYYLWSNNSSFPKLFREMRRGEIKNINIISDLPRTVDYDENIKQTQYFNPFLHQHTLIVDNEVLLTGTNNWTHNGFYQNDELVIVTDIDDVVSAFAASFSYHKTDLQGVLTVYDQQSKTFKFDQNDVQLQDLKVEIRNEISEEKILPSVCYSSLLLTLNTSVSIPNSCLKRNSHYTIYDTEYKIVSSGYLIK